MANKNIYSDANLRGIFSAFGLDAEQVKKAVIDFKKYREGKSYSDPILNYKDLEALSSGFEEYKKLEQAKDFLAPPGSFYNYIFYLIYKEAIAKKYIETGNWDTVINTEVYEFEAESSFVDYVEETYKTEIKDSQQLLELTGVKDEIAEIESIFKISNERRYERALLKCLEDGGKYKDLQKLTPENFNIKDKDQYKFIIEAISSYYNIDEPMFLYLFPDLRAVAKDLQAPYSVLMDCFNLTNRGIDYELIRS